MAMDDNRPPFGVPAKGEIALAVEELRSAAVFLTRIPARLIGADATRTPDFTHAARVFPVVGALIGAAGGVALVIAMWIGMPSLVAAGIAVAVTVAITGGLHEDGLADMTDSLGGKTTEQRLAIMDDSRIGTYGALALVFSVLLRVVALAALANTGMFRAAFALVAAEAVSRAALVRQWHDLPAARTGGLSSETGAPDQNAMLVALAIAAVIAILLGLPAIGLWGTLLASVLAAVATYGAVRLCARTIGGRTGDTLGACQQAALVAFLAGAAAG